MALSRWLPSMKSLHLQLWCKPTSQLQQLGSLKPLIIARLRDQCPRHWIRSDTGNRFRQRPSGSTNFRTSPVRKRKWGGPLTLSSLLQYKSNSHEDPLNWYSRQGRVCKHPQLYLLILISTQARTMWQHLWLTWSKPTPSSLNLTLSKAMMRMTPIIHRWLQYLWTLALPHTSMTSSTSQTSWMGRVQTSLTSKEEAPNKLR